MVSPVSAGGGFTRTGICTIVDMHSLEIEVDVNESYISRVQPGQDVDAVLDAYPDWQIPARVITTRADGRPAEGDGARAHRRSRSSIRESCRTWRIKVTFLARGGRRQPLPSAQPTTLVPQGRRSRPTAPTASRSSCAATRVERRAVRLGGTDGDRVEVLAGLQSGDRVVLSPPPTLADGVEGELCK